MYTETLWKYCGKKKRNSKLKARWKRKAFFQFRFFVEVLLIDNMFRFSEWDGKMWKDRIRKKNQFDSIYLHNKLNTVPFAYSDVDFHLFRSVNEMETELSWVGFLCETHCLCIWIHLLAFINGKKLTIYTVIPKNIHLNAWRK